MLTRCLYVWTAIELLLNSKDIIIERDALEMKIEIEQLKLESNPADLPLIYVNLSTVALNDPAMH